MPWVLRCSNVGVCSWQVRAQSREEAYEFWNTRASDAEVERLRAENAEWEKSHDAAHRISLANAARVEELRLAARGGSATNSTSQLLEFLADRIVSVHGESRNLDYIQVAYERAAMLERALKTGDKGPVYDDKGNAPYTPLPNKRDVEIAWLKARVAELEHECAQHVDARKAAAESLESKASEDRPDYADFGMLATSLASAVIPRHIAEKMERHRREALAARSEESEEQGGASDE